jgi:hypothetical protein
MPCVRYIFVCEGESEWVYLRRLQSFLDQQPVTAGHFETPLRLIAPSNAVAKGGSFKTLARQFRGVRRENKRSDIKVWADFDLYHRNNNSCADLYRGKTAGIPAFHFSFHNFEDFYALHLDEPQHQAWLAFGQQGHFVQPLHSDGYFPAFTQIAVGYAKGAIRPDFISWESLANLKHNKANRPTSNPQNLAGIQCFAEFLVGAIDQAFPGKLLP